MCGGVYNTWEKPRQLSIVNGESLVERTIRLLKENNIKDIYISANNSMFDSLGVPILKHDNNFTSGINGTGYWVNAFYPTDEPVCYLLGDVFYSDEAIKKIVETETDSIEFFASAPPFANNYSKNWAEPFGFKVVDTNLFKDSIEKVKELFNNHMFNRHPIAWELWQVIKKTPLNEINYNNYCTINDYTCDIDEEKDIKIIENNLKKE